MSTKTLKAKFNPGKIAATPAVMKKISPDYALSALMLHLQGDWGIVDEHDKSVNELALKDGPGGRVMSVYPLPDDPDNFWIITEIGSVTTFLLPSDY